MRFLGAELVYRQKPGTALGSILWSAEAGPELEKAQLSTAIAETTVLTRATRPGDLLAIHDKGTRLERRSRHHANWRCPADPLHGVSHSTSNIGSCVRFDR